ncbi:hypothetical protein [Nocardioides sp. W7]|uniref:hypothetical protein n=1 Tax=Nocardioides sp. W7 TaxID=2931390 RepID=UPI001FD4397F|nr:hypothetical protein [Nocardioides sp. W7]
MTVRSLQRAPAEGWVARAYDIAAQLAVGAIGCGESARPPHAQVRLLKDSGLVTLLGPVAHGGAGQDWVTALRVVRAVAEADDSVAQLLGYHYLWGWAGDALVEPRVTEESWLVSGARDPREGDLRVREDGGELVFLGATSLPAGGCASDVVVLVGAVDGSDRQVATVAPTGHPAIRFLGDPDAPRWGLAGAGDAVVNGVRVSPVVVGDVEPGDRLFPVVRLVFANLYLGIAAAALAAAAPHAVELRARLRVAEAVADRAATLVGRGDGGVELEVAATTARHVALDLGLEACSAATESVGGIGVHWRTLQVRRQHDPGDRVG